MKSVLAMTVSMILLLPAIVHAGVPMPLADSVMEGALRGAVIGGVAGGIGGLIVWAMKKKNPPSK